MVSVQLFRAAEDALRSHCEREYPREACGFLIGPDPASLGDASREIRRAIPAINEANDGRQRRFVIASDEVRRREAEVESSAEAVLGFYHSHPDQPAAPSRLDQAHAWPWYSYLVVSVESGRAREMTAFELNAKRRRFEPIRLEPADDDRVPPTGRPFASGPAR